MEVYSLLLRQLKFVGYSALASCEWWGHGDAIVANHGAKEKRRRGVEGGRKKRKSDQLSLRGIIQSIFAIVCGPAHVRSLLIEQVRGRQRARARSKGGGLSIWNSRHGGIIKL